MPSLLRIPWISWGWSPAITSPCSLLQLMSIKSETPSNNFLLCFPLLLLPSIFPSIGVFSNKSVLCITWPKYWSLSYSICPYYEYSELIFFRINWFDIHTVQGTVKSLLQHHSLKASVLWHSIFLIQLSHLYMTVSRSNRLLISWFQSLLSDFGAQENKICHYFLFYLP